MTEKPDPLLQLPQNPDPIDNESYVAKLFEQRVLVKLRPLSGKKHRITFNIMQLILSALGWLSCSSQFVLSSHRLRDFCYIILTTLYYTINLLIICEFAFVRVHFGFYYSNGWRGISNAVIGLLCIPTGTTDFFGYLGYGALALGVVAAIWGWWVVTVEEIAEM